MKYVKSFKLSNSLLFVSLLLLAFGCGKKSQKVVSEGNMESLKSTFSQITSELDSAWVALETDDDEKLFEMKRLLQEVSYTNVYDKEKYMSLGEQVEQLKVIRYDRKSMSDSGRIDEYDSATQKVMSDVISFAQNNPEFESYPFMKELILDIMESDHQVLFYRTSYDQVARAYNSFVDENKDMISEIGGGDDQLPLFALE